ncbi:MAG: AbrB/MazE/SpoVT family DNA-binding domain-containing protein [Firmicutes bacterium]|jgi:antitoxin component of MazEF toxin-antitoxin module|nr:AbrB/MazE/SpoVT family DNA-binding domain-containing protein [Bacillota bacterium]
MTIVTLQQRGNSQAIVIPSFYRRILGWDIGVKLYLEIAGDALVVRRVPDPLLHVIAGPGPEEVRRDVASRAD